LQSKIKQIMRIFIKIHSKEVDNYNTSKVELKNIKNIVPREGERVTVDKIGYDVKSVHYNFDNEEITITVL